MEQRIQNLTVLSNNSRGLLAALIVRRYLPALDLTVVSIPDHQRPDRVNTATTGYVPTYLSQVLNIDPKSLFVETRATWSLGLRLEHASDTHFDYPFASVTDLRLPGMQRFSAHCCLRDMQDCCHFHALMQQGHGPLLQPYYGSFSILNGGGVHLDESRFQSLLTRILTTEGIPIQHTNAIQVERSDDSRVRAVQLDDGTRIAADLYIDATHRASELLSDDTRASWHRPPDQVFCDRIIESHRPHGDTPIVPYSTWQPTDQGWRVVVPFHDRVGQVDVYNSEFGNPTSADASNEILINPGRLESFWTGNVIAVGDAACEVEPMFPGEWQTTIRLVHAAVQSLRNTRGTIIPKACEIENRWFRRHIDQVFSFQSMMYRFHSECDSPFWKHARQTASLGDATELVNCYQDAGPTLLSGFFLDSGDTFDWNAFTLMLIGLGVRPGSNHPHADLDADLRIWKARRDSIRADIQTSVPLNQVHAYLHDPHTHWPPTARPRS